MSIKSKSYLIVSIAVMAALAIVFDVFSDILPLRMPWGMKIDFVGTVWVLSYFLYGLSVAFPVSVITSLFIILVMPTGFVGGVMKFIATIPMFIIPAIFSYLPFFSPRSSKIFQKLPLIIGVGILANIVRILIATILNLYWAIPFYLGKTSEEILSLYGGLIPLIIFVSGLNLLQGIVDISVSWFLAFKFKLSTMFGTW